MFECYGRIREIHLRIPCLSFHQYPLSSSFFLASQALQQEMLFQLSLLILTLSASLSLAFDIEVHCIPTTGQRAIPIDLPSQGCLRAINEMSNEEDFEKMLAWVNYDTHDPDTILLPNFWGESYGCQTNLFVPSTIRRRVQEHFSLLEMVPVAVRIVNVCMIEAARGGRVRSGGGWAWATEGEKVKLDMIWGDVPDDPDWSAAGGIRANLTTVSNATSEMTS